MMLLEVVNSGRGTTATATSSLCQESMAESSRWLELEKGTELCGLAFSSQQAVREKPAKGGHADEL